MWEVGSALPAGEDDQHGELLVGGEAVVGAGRHEDRLPLAERVARVLDLERPVALEDDIDLVVVVRLLPVGLGRDEHLDTDLEARALVDDLVAAACRLQPALRVVYAEGVGAHCATLRFSPDAGSPRRSHSAAMTPASYAMFWWMEGGARRAGRIELGDDFVSLSATTPDPAEERVRFRDLAAVLLDRGLLHLDRGGMPSIHIGSLDTPGALRELADRLSDGLRAAPA